MSDPANSQPCVVKDCKGGFSPNSPFPFCAYHFNSFVMSGERRRMLHVQATALADFANRIALEASNETK